jgi:hypothetical protein
MIDPFGQDALAGIAPNMALGGVTNLVFPLISALVVLAVLAVWGACWLAAPRAVRPPIVLTRPHPSASRPPSSCGRGRGEGRPDYETDGAE